MKTAFNFSISLRRAIGSLLLIICFAAGAHAQAQATSVTANATKKYVRIDIGHGALHCPFLGPKFEAALRKISGIEDFVLDKQTSCVTFTLPSDTDQNAETLKKVGTDAGYPAADVSVTMADKPIEAPAKK